MTPLSTASIRPLTAEACPSTECAFFHASFGAFLLKVWFCPSLDWFCPSLNPVLIVGVMNSPAMINASGEWIGEGALAMALPELAHHLSYHYGLALERLTLIQIFWADRFINRSNHFRLLIDNGALIEPRPISPVNFALTIPLANPINTRVSHTLVPNLASPPRLARSA